MNACLMPVLAADGCHVTTIEGIGTVKGDNLHPIQKAMVETHGSQCGKKFLFYLPPESVHVVELKSDNSHRILHAGNHCCYLRLVCQQYDS